MGKTSSEVKDRYNAKAYDSFLWRVPKGKKAEIQAAAQERGLSLSAYLGQLVEQDSGIILYEKETHER